MPKSTAGFYSRGGVILYVQLVASPALEPPPPFGLPKLADLLSPSADALSLSHSFALLYNSFTGMAEITSSYSQRPIVVRQRGYAMIRPSADILAMTLVDLPFKAISIIVFDIVLCTSLPLLASLQPGSLSRPLTLLPLAQTSWQASATRPTSSSSSSCALIPLDPRLVLGFLAPESSR